MPKVVDVSRGEQVALFGSIAIEIASRCNRHCHFCPNGHFDRVDDYMPWETVIGILQQLGALKYKGRIEWYIYNEPTRDPRLVSFITAARSLVPRACQMINTNGDYLLGPEHIADYLRAGLNQMQINIYSASDRYEEPQFSKGVEEAFVREQRITNWKRSLFNEFPTLTDYLSTYANIGPRKHAIKVVAKYGIKPTAKSLGEHQLQNRSGNLPGFAEELAEPLKKMCTRPFRFLNINFNGDGLLCCNDYYGKKTFGNVRDTSLVDIWNAAELHQYRIKLQAKNRDCFLCDVCDFNGGPYPHMVDTVVSGSKETTVAVAGQRINEDVVLSFPIVNQQRVMRLKTEC